MGARLTLAQDISEPDQVQPDAHAEDRTPGGEPAAEPKPLEIGLQEEAGVSLLLLDVEVYDEDGAPVRGLTREDFRVWERLREWEIYSVDDLCACGEPAASTPGPAAAAVPHDESGRPAAAVPHDESGRPAAAVPHDEPGRPATAVPHDESGRPATASNTANNGSRLFVMFFDFSQMRRDGRTRALDASRRWIQETMQPEDRLLMAGYATAAGLRRISLPSSDRRVLLNRLEEAFEGPDLVDPYPDFRPGRILHCRQDPFYCDLHSWAEYLHGRASLRAFKLFLAGLEVVPGRKQLFYFSQNGGLFPYRLFKRRGPDHRQVVAEIAAEAMASRTVINTVNTGLPALMEKSAEQAVSLGWNLGEFTGGAYNRAPKDLFALLQRVTTRCGCTYRIGLTPLQADHSDVHVLRVEAAGRTLPHRYRIRYLTPADRVFRTMAAYMQDVAAADAFPLWAFLQPVSVKRKRWDVGLQARFDLRSLLHVPRPGRRASGAYWDLGGLLYDMSGRAEWEFLATASAGAGESAPPSTVTLHESVLGRLRPGEYRFVIVVHDRNAGTYAAAEAFLTLPAPSQEGILGPFCVEVRSALRSSLPLRAGPKGPSDGETVQLSAVPCIREGTAPGTLLLMQTWFCSGNRRPAPAGTQGLISRSGVPVFRLWPSPGRESGTCTLVTDTVDTAWLDPGLYRYHLTRSGAEVGTLDFSLRSAPVATSGIDLHP